MSNSIFDDVYVTDQYTVGDPVINVEDILNQVDTIIYTKENLFERAVVLNEQLATIKADIKQLKEDFTWDADYNPKGLDKEAIKEVMTFASKYVSESVDKVIEQAAVFESLKEELLKD